MLVDREWLSDHKLELSILGAALLLGTVAFLGSLQQEQEWHQFAAEHHCVVIATQKSQTTTGSDGNFYVTPATATYRCDDGSERIR